MVIGVRVLLDGLRVVEGGGLYGQRKNNKSMAQQASDPNGLLMRKMLPKVSEMH